MKWLKEHQDHEVCLVGVDELTKSRTRCVQVLYEFGIMSTCLPDVKIPQMSVYISEKTSTSLSFKVPEIPKNKRLTGLNMTFKYTIAGDDLVWFAKVSTTIGVDFIYNPTVFGRPSIGEVGIWLSYWPIGNMLHIKDEINVSIVVISGLEVCECGARLVYSDDEVADGTFKHNIGWLETLGGDLSAFQLSNKAYYLCRRDFFDKMEVDEPTPRWFRNIVGGNIDHADVRGWGKTGRPEQANSSFTQLKTVRDEGLLVEESYNVAEKSGTTSEMKDAATKETDNPVPFILSDPLISMASPGANALRYDVFLSFRGEDTRHSFMDHVYAALVRAGLHTFRDSDDIGRGSQLSQEIESAIKASEASVILLSNNYATSSWCLDELLLILGHMRECDHFVLPVFYHVDPSDVRKQTNHFNIKVDKTSTRWTDYNVNRWKKALTEVASLSGFVVSGSEPQSVKKIVDIIYKKLASNRFTIWDYIKVKLVVELDESDLGHMKWLKEYQNHNVCLVGNDELAIGRRSYIQILYEYDIMSTSLPDTKDPNMTQYISESPSLCFEVLPYPKNRRLKGLDVTFKYTISGDDLAWFAKVNTTNGIDLLYNPTVFGKPEPGEVGMWFSYWPIGNKLAIGDKVNVSIIVMSGLEVIECGASLVYTYDVADEKLESNMGWGETLGGDLSRFQLSTGAYYLCRSDFSSLMEAGRLSPDWFRRLAGDAVDYTEVQGWKISGRPKHVNPQFTELN